MSSAGPNTESTTDQQVLSHFASRKLRENGGPVAVTAVAYEVSDVADLTAGEATDLIENGTGTIYTVGRDQHGEQQIERVNPIGGEPTTVSERFGGPAPGWEDFVALDGVTAPVEAALAEAGMESFEDVAEADPETLATAINDALDSRAEVADFDELTGLTDSEVVDLQHQDITTKRDLVQADPQYLESQSQSATLRAAKVKQVQRQVAEDVEIWDASDTREIISAAQRQLPASTEIAATQIERHEARKDTLGHAGAIVTDVEAQTETVGEPLAVVRNDLDPADPEANYRETRREPTTSVVG